MGEAAPGSKHFSRFDGHYVTLARKSCNDSHLGVIQQPRMCVKVWALVCLDWGHELDISLRT
jgi:hypothetical protein